MKNTTYQEKRWGDERHYTNSCESLTSYHCCVMYYRFPDISSITWKQVNDDLRDKGPSVLSLIDLVLSLPASSAEAERGFSLMKTIKTDWRSRLTDDSVSDLMTINLKDFDQQPAIDVWLQKKRMPYFSDNRSRLRREEQDGPAEIPEDRDAHVCVEAQQEVQAAVPVPSEDAKHSAQAYIVRAETSSIFDDDDDLSDYYPNDELVTENNLIDQENEAYKMLTSMF